MGQVKQGIFDLDVDKNKKGYKYYSQPHEVDSQVFGFRRMSKVTKKPFDVLVDKWFDTHRDIHQMGDNDIERVKQLVHDRNSKI